MRRLHSRAGMLAFLASFALSSSAWSQVKIGKLEVTVMTAPSCDQFPPVPTAVANSVGICEGGFYQDGNYRVGDPFADISSLAGVSPYVALNDGGSVTYAPAKAGRSLLILWGTIDQENTITLLAADGTTTASISGSDLLNAGIIQSYGGTNLYLSIKAKQEFWSVTMSEPDVSSDSFEFSDIRFATHPPTCP